MRRPARPAQTTPRPNARRARTPPPQSVRIGSPRRAPPPRPPRVPPPAPPAAGTQGCSPAFRGRHTSGCPTPGTPLRGKGRRDTPAPPGRGCGDRRSATPPRPPPPSGCPRERVPTYPRRARARRGTNALWYAGRAVWQRRCPSEIRVWRAPTMRLPGRARVGRSTGVRCATPPDPGLPRVEPLPVPRDPYPLKQPNHPKVA